jgi:hypothetical protein
MAINPGDTVTGNLSLPPTPTTESQRHGPENNMHPMDSQQHGMAYGPSTMDAGSQESPAQMAARDTIYHQPVLNRTDDVNQR